MKIGSALCLLALLLVACGGQTDRAARARVAAQDQAINVAERAVRTAPERAVALFGAIADDPRYADKDRLMARYRLGELALTKGDLPAATTHFAHVAASSHPERASLGAYRLARLQLDEQADYEGGRQALVEVARTRPDTLGAVQAIKALARTRPDDREHAQWVVEALAGLAAAGGAIAPAATWWKAQLEAQQLEDTFAAERTLRGLVDRHPAHPRVGAALWTLGALLSARGDWAQAAGVYDELSQVEPERGWFIGSNRERRVDDAILMSGRIHLYRLNDAPQAILRFERMLDEFPEGILADDAAYEIARAHAAVGEIDSARAALETLIETYSHSRYVDDAHAILGGAPWPRGAPRGFDSEDESRP